MAWPVDYTLWVLDPALRRVLGARRLRLRAQRTACFPPPCSVLFWQPGQREGPCEWLAPDLYQSSFKGSAILEGHTDTGDAYTTAAPESRGPKRLDGHSQPRAPGRGGAGGGSWQRVLGYPRRWSCWPERPLLSREVQSRRGHAPGPPVYAAPSPGTAAAAGRCARCLCKSPVPPRGDAPPLGSGQRPRKAAALQSGDPGHPRSPLRAGRRPRRRRWPGRP